MRSRNTKFVESARVGGGGRFRSWSVRAAILIEDHAGCPSARLHGGVEPQNVMREAQQRPLPFYFCFSPEQKVAKSARLFDLSEHRFHHALARRIDRFAHLGL